MKTKQIGKTCLLVIFTFVSINFQDAFSQQSITWVDIVGLDITGDNIRKTEVGDAWGNGGAASMEVLNSNLDGWVESTVLELDKARMIGFSEMNSDANYTTIDYAIYLRHTGELKVYEKGINKFTAVNNYLSGDKVKVERMGGVINYKINDNIFYTSLITSTTSLLVDISIFDLYGTLNNIKISDSFTGQDNSGNTNEEVSWIPNSNNLYFENAVAIGRTNTIQDYILSVEGKIITQEIKVTLDEWSDFVFENNYNLPTLREVEQYIKNKGHLKGIPSAEEVKKDGFFLGKMDSKLLQKIEELTLYTIKQQKEIEVLKKENKTQQSLSLRLAKIEKLISDKK
ncbi:hypothetical protein Q4Q34_15445 [Flavivirga abyssicola]|uniref:hypothetical protein n=1 Tax=Flavivirga abyssicola TaxID=3063533 RepID=UPI0026DFA858|nr:hypothetical protein [Flavivirga sp. MEBiC07777]WVK12611.1 hypothetical protein Q4Q34_15445 [Flavivirga sp. MEBiC07777]